VRYIETSASEPLMKHRNEKRVTSKPGLRLWPGRNPAGACRLAGWCPVYRWRDAVSGSFKERGNPSCDVKRKPYK
jgi:hypothetical protein